MEKLKFIKDLISIKSFDTKQNKEIITYLEKQFSPIAKEIIKIKNKNNDCENMLIGLNTKLENARNAIVLSGHIDTVIADEKEYKTNPYQPTQIGDKIFGLGAIDMKSFFACILNNAKELLKLNSPIIIAITSDEETALTGVSALTDLMRELKIIPKFTIVGEPTNMEICTLSKSCYEFHVEFYGKSCHSSNPSLGINSNVIAAKLVLYISKLCKKYKDTTLSPNVIQGGEKVNIIPNYCKIFFDLRSNKMKNKEKILKKIQKYAKKLEKNNFGAKIAISNSLEILPLENKKSKIKKEILKVFSLKESSFTGGCEAGYYQALGGDAIVFGVGDLSLAHKPNEFVNINEFLTYNDLLLNVMQFVDNKN